MKGIGVNWEVVAKHNSTVSGDDEACAVRDRPEPKRAKHGYFSSLNRSKLNQRLTGNIVGIQRSVEARKKAPSRITEKPQRSFTLENHTESTEVTSGVISKQSNATHKRTKTLGEKPNFILDKSKPKIGTSGSSLMAKLSEKLQLDLGKMAHDRGQKKVEVFKKHQTGDHSHRINLETNSLAKRIAQMKSSCRPLTERNNPHHLGILF